MFRVAALLVSLATATVSAAADAGANAPVCGPSSFPGRTAACVAQDDYSVRPRPSRMEVSASLAPASLANAAFDGTWTAESFHDSLAAALGAPGIDAPRGASALSGALVVALADVSRDDLPRGSALRARLDGARDAAAGPVDPSTLITSADGCAPWDAASSLMSVLTGKRASEHGIVSRTWVDPVLDPRGAKIFHAGSPGAYPAAATATEAALHARGGANVAVSGDASLASLVSGHPASYGAAVDSDVIVAPQVSTENEVSEVCAALRRGGADGARCADGYTASSIAVVVPGAADRATFTPNDDASDAALFAELGAIAALDAYHPKRADGLSVVSIAVASLGRILAAERGDTASARYTAAAAMADAILAPHLARASDAGRAVAVIATGAGESFAAMTPWSDARSAVATASLRATRNSPLLPGSAATAPAIFANPDLLGGAASDAERRIAASFADPARGHSEQFRVVCPNLAAYTDGLALHRAQMEKLAAQSGSLVGSAFVGNATPGGNGSHPVDPFAPSSYEISLFQLGLWTFILLLVTFGYGICIVCSVNNDDPLLNPPKSKMD